jgi:SAM-dependent methyltransferase
VRCATYDFVFLNPQPTDTQLGHFYNHSYRYDMRRYKNSIPQQRIWLDLLEKFCGGPGNLQEVGCSYGYFLAAAKKRGWSVYGVDLGEEAADFARKELGLAVDRGAFSTCGGKAPLPLMPSRRGMCSSMIPPRGDSSTRLTSCCARGILGLRVPNLRSTVAKLADSCWQWLSPPERVCMYTLETLSRLLADRFKILGSRTERGKARNMWVEVLRARTKQLLARNADLGHWKEAPGSFARPAVYENRLWYRAAERVMEFAPNR